MRFETMVDIDAPVETVWKTLVDVERWPEWSSSITRVELLEAARLGPGVSVRIKQPRMPAMVWQVTDFHEGSAFTWRSTRSGITTVATHVLTPAGPQRGAARLGVSQSGPLAPVVGFLTARTTRRYVQLEAQGLKKRSEGDWVRMRPG